MSVSEPFIRRPIATSLLGIALFIGGALGYWALPVSALPQVDFPTVEVTTQLPGASPDVIASLITAPLERQLGQIPSLYAQVYQPVALAGIAQPGQRNLMDIDDAMSMDSLKTSMVSDQTTQGMLTLADSLEQQAMTAAPGSASMVTAQARVADLVTQAQLAKMLAAQLRQEATKLAHQNATLKHSATTTQNLFNQIQQVLAHP